MSTTRQTPYQYETVAAGQTAQVLNAPGGSGATGDELRGLWVNPATTAPGVVTILDNATSIPLYTGGTVGADLKGWWIELGGIKSVSGAWKVTTGANVSVVAVGRWS